MGKAIRGATPPPVEENDLSDLEMLADETADLEALADETAGGGEKKNPAQTQNPKTGLDRSITPAASPNTLGGRLLLPWGDSDTPSPYALGLPAAMDEKGMLAAVKKRKGLTDDQEARNYIAAANQVYRTKEKHNDSFRDLGVGDVNALLKQDPAKLGDWYKETKTKLNQELTELKKNTNYSEDNAVGAAAGMALIKAKEEQIKKLDLIKDDVLTEGLAQYKDPARIGLEYAKIYEPEKLKMIKKRMGIPAAMEPEVLTRVNQEEMKKMIPQSMLYNMELKGSTIAMNQLSDQIAAEMPDFKAAKAVYEQKIRNIEQAKGKTFSELPEDDADLVAAQSSFENDPAVVSYADKANQLHQALRNTVMLPAKYPSVAEAFRKKADIEKNYEEQNPFVRQFFQTPNFKKETESGAYGLLGGAGAGFLKTFGGVAKTAMTVAGQLGMVPEEQAYLRNVEIQDEMDTEFYTPEGARLQNNGKVNLPAGWDNMIKDIGLDQASVEQVYGQSDTKFNPGGIMTTMGETTGQVVGQAVISRGIGSAIGAVAAPVARGAGVALSRSKVPGNVGTGMDKISQAMRNPAFLQDRVGLFASTYATTYGDNYQSAIDNNLDPDTAEQYALVSSFGTALTEMISPDTKILRRAMGAVPNNAAIQNTIDALNSPNLSKADRILNATKAYGKAVFKNVASETLEEVADAAKTHVLDAAYDIDTTKMTFSEDAQNTALQTAIGMIPMAIAGGYGATSRLRKEALWQAGNDPQRIMGFMQAKIDAEADPSRKDEMQTELNQVGKVVNTMTSIVKGLPKVNKTGRELSEGERMDLAEALFKNRKLKKDAENIEDEPLKEPIEQAAQAAAAQASAIINGTAPAYIINGQSVTPKQATDFLQSDEYKNKPDDYQVQVYNDLGVESLIKTKEKTPATETAAQPAGEGGLDINNIQPAENGGTTETAQTDISVQPGTQTQAAPAGTNPVQTQPEGQGSNAGTDQSLEGVSAKGLIPVRRTQGEDVKNDRTDDEAERSLKVGLPIKSRFQQAPKAIADKSFTKTLPDKSKISGKYILYPADAVTASHDPNTFTTSEGYPLLPTGANPNDNDYSRPENKAQVYAIASEFDDRALTDIPTITPDGIVIDGNNRTMSSQLAAKQRTDAAYNEALKERLNLYGLTQEDYDFVAAKGTPRIGFMTDEIPEYDTPTYAKFNKNTKKEKSPLARAVELGRVVTPDVISQIGDTLESHDTLSDFYKDRKSTKKVIDLMVARGYLLENEVPRYYDRTAGALNASGKELLESLMLGNAVGEAELGLLNKEGILNYRQKIVRAIKTITAINGLGEQYSIKELMNKAIRLKNELVTRKMDISDYVAQMDMFSSEMPDAETILVFFNMDGTEKEFKEFLKRYESQAQVGASGAVDLFTGAAGVSQQEILSSLAQKLNDKQRQIAAAGAANQSQQQQPGQTGEATDGNAGQENGTGTDGRPADEETQSDQTKIEANATQREPLQDGQVPPQSGGSQYTDAQERELQPAEGQTAVEPTDTGDLTAGSGNQAQELTPAENAGIEAMRAVPENMKGKSNLWTRMDEALAANRFGPVLAFLEGRAKDPRDLLRTEREFGKPVAAAARALWLERNPTDPINVNPDTRQSTISAEDVKAMFPEFYEAARANHRLFVNQPGQKTEAGKRAGFDEWFRVSGFGWKNMASISGLAYTSNKLTDIRTQAQWDKIVTIARQAEQLRAMIEPDVETSSAESTLATIAKSTTYTPEEKAVMSSIVRAHRDPNFNFQVGKGKGRTSGYYSLARNILDLTEPHAFSHEIGHYGMEFLLDGNDRMKYLEEIGKRIDGKTNLKDLLKDNIVRKSTGTLQTNTMDNLAEYFAENYAQYVASNTGREENEVIYGRFMNRFFETITKFWKDLVGEISDIARVDASLIPLYNKIVDISKLPRLNATVERQEKNPPVAPATPEPVQTAPVDAPDAVNAADVTPDAVVQGQDQARQRAIQIAADRGAAEAKLRDLFNQLEEFSDVPEAPVRQSNSGLTPEALTEQIVAQTLSLGISGFQEIRNFMIQNNAIGLLPYMTDAYRTIRDTYSLPQGMTLDDDATIDSILNPPGKTPPPPPPGAVASGNPPAGSFGDLDFGRTKKLERDISDYQIRAKQIQDKINQNGGRIDKSSDYYTLFYLAGNKTAALTAEIDRYVGNDKKPSKDSFISRLKNEAAKWMDGKGDFFAAGNDQAFIDPTSVFNKLALYMYAKHAPERNAYNAKYRQDRINEEVQRQMIILNQLMQEAARSPQATMFGVPSGNQQKIAEVTKLISDLTLGKVEGFPLMADGGSGMSNAQADATIKAAQDAGIAPLFDQYAAEYRENVIKPILDQKYKYGLISQESYDQLANTYQHYLPLKADTQEDDGYTTFNNRVDADLFRAKGAVDLLADARVNPIIQAAVDLKYTIIQGEKNLVYQALGNLIAENPDPIWRVSTFVHTDQETGRVIDPDASYKKDGSSRFIYIKDPELKKAVTKGAMETGKQFALVRDIMRYLSTVQTTLSPSFIVNNALSDYFTANANLTGMNQSEIMAKVNGYVWGAKGKKFLGAARAIWGYEGNKSEGVSEWQDWARRFATEGGKISYMDMYNTKDEIAKMKENFEKDFDPKQSGPRVLDGVRSVMSYIERLNTSIENGVRLASFRALVESGMPAYQAADFAKGLTTDFNKKGNFSPIVNLYWQFFNAGVQGIKSGARALTTKKGMYLAGALPMLGFGMAMLNDMYSDCEGDEKNTDCYWNMQDWEKETYLILPGGDGYFKMRLPRFWGAFYAAGVKAYDAVNGHGNLATFGKFMVNTAWNTTVPFSSGGGLIDDDNELRAGQLFPSLAQPFVSFIDNKDNFGRPIYKEGSPYQPRVPDSQLAFKKTPSFYTGLAQTMNDWTGGNKFESGAIDISPNSIEYWAKFGGGGLYNFAEKLYSTSESVAAGEVPAMKDIPIVSNLYTQPVKYLNLGQIYKMIENSGRNIYTPEEVQEFNKLLDEASKKQEGGSRYLDAKRARTMRKQFLKKQRELKRNVNRLDDN